MYREIVSRGANLQDELVAQEISIVDCFKRVDLLYGLYDRINGTL